MIITNQDKTEIVNFNNILSVKLFHDDEDKECLYEIYTTVNAPGDNYILLGAYKTEERAKEVLREISKKYENSMWKLGRSTLSFNDEFIYEMPKE